MDTKLDSSRLTEFLRVTNEGLVESGDFNRMWEEICSQDFWRPGISILFDNRRLRVPDNAYQLTEEAAKYFVSKIDEIGDGRIAVIMTARANLQFGYQFNYQIGRTDQRIQYFFDELEAIRWISTPFGQAA